MQANARRHQRCIVPPQVVPNADDDIAPTPPGYFRRASCCASVRIIRQVVAWFAVNPPTNVLVRLEVPGRLELPSDSGGRPRCSATFDVSVLTEGISYLATWVFRHPVTEPQLVIAAAVSLSTATDSSLPV